MGGRHELGSSRRSLAGSGMRGASPEPPPKGPDARGILTERDGRILADAIRRGRATGPAPSQKRRVIWSLASGMIVLAALLILIGWLLSNRPSQRLVAMTTNLEALRSIAFTSSGAGSTSLAPVYARTIGVRDSRSDVELFLPLPIGECEALAAALGSSCSSATIELEAPIDLVARDHPVRVDTTSAEWSRMTLGFDGAAEQESGRSMSMLVEGKMTTQVCVSPPESATQLRVRLATGVSAPVTLPADDGALLRCEDGVRLAFRPLVGEAPTSGLTFRGIGELALAVQGARAEVDVLAGSLSLVDVETVIFDPGQHVAIEGDASSPVALELTRVGDESKATFTAQSVHDAVTDAGSLLPTRWELDAALWTPVTGLLAAISVGLFQLGVKGLGTWWFEGRPSIE